MMLSITYEHIFVVVINDIVRDFQCHFTFVILSQVS